MASTQSLLSVGGTRTSGAPVRTQNGKLGWVNHHQYSYIKTCAFADWATDMIALCDLTP